LFNKKKIFFTLAYLKWNSDLMCVLQVRVWVSWCNFSMQIHLQNDVLLSSWQCYSR